MSSRPGTMQEFRRARRIWRCKRSYFIMAGKSSWRFMRGRELIASYAPTLRVVTFNNGVVEQYQSIEGVVQAVNEFVNLKYETL